MQAVVQLWLWLRLGRRRLVDEAHDALHEPPAGGAQQAVEVEAVVLSLRLH